MRTRLPLLLSFAMLASSGLAFAEKNGISGYSGNPGINSGRSCDYCHFGGTAPTVDIAGPMTVTPGSTSRYTLTISGGQSAWGGLDVSATLGALSAIMGQGTKLSSGELVHSAEKAAVGGNVTFDFNWTAPSTAGDVAIYGAGLSTDGSGTRGDGLGLVALVVSVASAPPSNLPPVAVAGGPYSGTMGTAIPFDGSGSYDSDGMIASYAWNFGDGSTGMGAMPSHVYTAPGTYTVSLTVTDDAGASDTKTTTANVNDPSPTNQMPVPDTGGPYTGIVGTALTFDGSASYDPDGTIVAWDWNFGDGSTGSGMSVDHAYASPAAYPVTLTVTDDAGASASKTTNATVREATASSLLVMVHAKRVVKLEDDERETKVRVTADLSSLPPGTTGCGTATLYMNDSPVGTEPICIKGRGERDDDDDDRERKNKTLRVKTARGVVDMSRPMQGPSAKAKFKVELSSADAPSVVWTAEVDLAGYYGESAPVTTQIVMKRR